MAQGAAPSATIVGAGVVGLALAAELTARGVAARLIDRHGAPGAHGCSWWAGGMLAPHCERESAEEPVVRLGALAADWWDRHAGGVVRQGSLVIAPTRDRREIDRFARRTEGYELLDAEAIATLEPDLAGRFQRALYFPTEAHLAPRQTLARLLARLAEAGVTLEQDEIAPQDVPGTVFDCRGLAARDDLPGLRGVKGEMLVLNCLDVSLARPVRLIHPRMPLYIVPRGDGVFMLGATQIEATERGRITARSMLELLSAAYALHPAFGEAEVAEIGVDARPAFASNLPRIIRQGHVIHLNGLFRHGFLLAPALAMQAADLWLKDERPELLHDDLRERGGDRGDGDHPLRAAE
ncbi:MAG: FAD-dependent oxidoreductase [Pseudomonadota bacterium]